jgi:hypothetical protein
LVNDGSDLSIGLAYLADSGYLPGHVVADTKTVKVAFVVEVVHLAQGILKWRLAVRTMEVPHVDLSGIKSLETRQETASHVLKAIGVDVVAHLHALTLV